MDVLDLRRLRLLRELSVRGTLSAVAAAAGYTPSAVSQQLDVLAREVGTPLLTKAGRGVRLTDAGQRLVQHAEVLLSADEAARADLHQLTRALGQLRGTVRAAGLQSAARHLLVPAVAALSVDHPHVEVHLTEAELEQALPGLQLGSLDLCVCDEYDGQPRPRPAGLRSDVVLREPLRLVLPLSHPLAANDTPVELSSLADQPWVSAPSGTGHHQLVLAACRSRGGFDPTIRHHASDAEVHLDLVRHARAVTLLPTLSLPHADPTLAIREIAGPPMHRTLLLITRASAASPAVTAFVAAVRHAATRPFGEVTSG
ncbi:DNA-binding transcriptional regulator, LysR family [Quadrisphaera granulorum]|uniref:DNA-binding transcriptional LysR family regulator n=1 Tax=Quadrisphaera granulorum TaxID=317664 RepID=A0A316A7P3_9ACTN|nr:LysR substrate-binding domain-containing protein [Quadrisphaera granulorum]PWJ53881.1 DNA-binding transcriptional LysR family regulator [Quadrisphaera granulorum]SZE96638.1 DNA-binding transcriptional regulator, LysR family [Quadrisphaera granulorum]